MSGIYTDRLLQKLGISVTFWGSAAFRFSCKKVFRYANVCTEFQKPMGFGLVWSLDTGGNMEGQTERQPYIRVKIREHLVTTSGYGDLILSRPAKVDLEDR